MADIKWNKKDLNTGKDSSGVANIDKITGKDQGISQGYTHGSLTKGLVAYYPMERGKGQIIRDAALNNFGLLKGGFDWVNGNVEANAIEFNGEDAYLISEEFSPPAGGLNNQFCTAFWFKTTGSDGKYIANQRGDSGWRYYGKITDSGELLFNLYDNDFGGNEERIVVSDSTINDGAWHHALINLSSGQMRLYIDGDLEDTVDCTGDSNYGELYLGSVPDNTRQGPDFIQITMDAIYFYERALSEPEIEALYNLTRPNGVEITEGDVPSQGDGGVSRWRFDDDQDTDTAVDSWGSNDGDINGAVYTSQRVYGDNSINFNSDEDEGITIQNDMPELDPVDNSLSVSVWVKPISDYNQHTILAHDEVDSEGRFAIGLDNNHLGAAVDVEESGTIIGEDVVTGEWVHMVAVWDHKEMEDENDIWVFHNGKRVASTGRDLGIGYLIDHNNPGTFIGYRSEEDEEYRSFGGNLDDLRIYDRALSPLEVEKLFKKGSYRINRSDTLQ